MYNGKCRHTIMIVCRLSQSIVGEKDSKTRLRLISGTAVYGFDKLIAYGLMEATQVSIAVWAAVMAASGVRLPAQIAIVASPTGTH